MSKIIYIAGKVTGEEATACAKKFEEAENLLLTAGYTTVLNPVAIVARNGWQNESWQFIMRHCMMLVAKCDVIYCLPDWSQSRGAKLERYVALSLGIEIIDAPQTPLLPQKNTT